MKKCNTDEVKHEMSATHKKCDIKRVQHKATREKVQHEKRARVKNEKKKNVQEQCTRVHKWITGRPLMDHWCI